jgi:hypothetical protein
MIAQCLCVRLTTCWMDTVADSISKTFRVMITSSHLGKAQCVGKLTLSVAGNNLLLKAQCQYFLACFR